MHVASNVRIISFINTSLASTRGQALGIKAEPCPGLTQLPNKHELKHRVRFITVYNMHNKESVYLSQRKEWLNLYVYEGEREGARHVFTV